jgi:hypothetical protein
MAPIKDNLIYHGKIKKFIKELDARGTPSMWPVLNEMVKEIIRKAVKRAHSHQKRTLRPEDF